MALAFTHRIGGARQVWLAALKFGGLSGAGWVLDFCLLLLMVGGFGVPPSAANVVSSCIAALSVFLLSRRFIFARSDGAFGSRVAIYMLYTLCVIAAAALAIGLLVRGLDGLAQGYGLHPSRTVLAAVAKVVVTPPQLLMNFLMSRHMSERAMGRPA